MASKKQIVCLAASWKNKDYCVAGKGLSDGQWIRPCGGGSEGAAKLSEIQIAPGVCPSLLDVVEVSVTSAAPEHHQVENWSIDIASKWRKVSTYPKTKLEALLDAPTTLWTNAGGKNDRVAANTAHTLLASLYLIQPKSVVFYRTKSLAGSNQTRGQFNYNGIDHDLVVTDPAAVSTLNIAGIGKQPISKITPYLCISLTLNGPSETCFKLIAGVIFP